MQRKDKEIISQEAMENIIKKARVCRLALSDGNIPYIVPVCFGYKDMTLYVHSAPAGKKIDILKKNPHICVEFDINAALQRAAEACEWTIKYQSVIGYGEAVFLKKPEDKREAFHIIMKQYSDDSFQFSDSDMRRAAVIKIKMKTLTGKQSGF